MPFSSFINLECLRVLQKDQSYMYLVKSKSVCCACPSCHTAPHRVHSRYTRFLQDVPAHGKSAYIQIQTRKFFCDNSTCSQAIFTERFTWIGTYQRKTKRLQKMLRSIALSTSCKVASRLSKHIGIATGHHTLLRLLHRLELPPYEPPVHIGIDDFAFKKRSRYGTLIVNQQTRRPIAILNGRNKEIVVEWLKKHPSIQIVTRDGSTTYANAISEALPHAYQIGDRWHILKGLFTALSETLQQSIPPVWREKQYSHKDKKLERPPLRKTDVAIQDRENLVWERSLEAKKWKDEGKSIAWIARHMKLCRNTIYKDLRRERKPSFRRPRALDSYLNLLEDWNASGWKVDQMEEALRKEGYKGSRSTLNTAVAELRHAHPVNVITHSISRAALLWDIWNKEDNQWLDELPAAFLKKFPHIRDLHHMTRRFREILNKKTGYNLLAWLTTYEETTFPALQAFIRYIKSDIKAIIAAFSHPLSNGLSEGHINRLKMLKRMMYGRASNHLLMKRVLLTL